MHATAAGLRSSEAQSRTTLERSGVKTFSPCFGSSSGSFVSSADMLVANDATDASAPGSKGQNSAR